MIHQQSRTWPATGKTTPSAGGAQHDDKERFTQLLQDADNKVDDEILDKLPTAWEEVLYLYVNIPILYDIKTCCFVLANLFKRLVNVVVKS